MKWVLYVVYVLMILSGSLFALQGLSVLPSRAMYGKPEWIVIGAAMVVGGVGLGVFTYRRARSSTSNVPSPKS
jgi:hypothetical protein